MILTAIVAGIIGAFFGLIIACLIRTAGDADEDAWRAWVDHMLAQEADAGNADAVGQIESGHFEYICQGLDARITAPSLYDDSADGIKTFVIMPSNPPDNVGDGDNLVVLERGELAEVERLSALLERCRPYMRHAPLCNYVRNGVECDCDLDGVLEEIDGWVMAAKAPAIDTYQQCVDTVDMTGDSRD